MNRCRQLAHIAFITSFWPCQIYSRQQYSKQCGSRLPAVQQKLLLTKIFEKDVENKMKAKVLACLLLAPFCANATPINWTLQDVVIGTFINGNSFPNAGDTVSLTGSFTYDADLNIYSNINIHSAPGTGLICAFPDQVPPNSECQGFFLASMPAANYNYAATDSTASILITLDSTKFFDGLLGDPLLALKFASNLSNLGGSVGFAENSVEYLCPEVLTCPFDSKKN